MQFINKLFHKLLNPHCIECAAERACKSCNEMRELLAMERLENSKLLGLIRDLAIPEKAIIPEAPKVHHAPLPTRKSWRENAAILEANDRANAESLRVNQKVETIKVDPIDLKVKSIDEIEAEMGITNAS